MANPSNSESLHSLMLMINVLWQPQSGPQVVFHKSPVFEVLYGGAAGGGKSDSLLMEGLRQAHKKYYRAIVFRRTYPELQELIDRAYELFPRVFPGATWNEQKKRWVFPSGAMYYFGAMEHENDKYKYQGKEYQYIAFDELTQFAETQYLYLHSRCRTKDGSVRCYIRASSNPGGIGHGWVKTRFVDHGAYNVIADPDTGLTRCFIPSKVYDNKILMTNDPLYVKRLMALPEDERRALLEGDWDVYAGQYFREFRKHKHVIDPFSIPAEWKRFRSIDWGYNDPCAVYWHAVGPEKRVFTYRELYVRQTLPSEVAKKIIELSVGEDIEYTAASPDMWAKKGMAKGGLQGETIAETFLLNGVPVVKADNDRLQGWQRMHEYLADAPDGLPYWQIFSTCDNLIRTLPALVHDDYRVEDVSDKCEDHGPESCRYGLMSRPSVVAHLGLAPDDWAQTTAPRGTVEEILQRLKHEREEQEEYNSWNR